MTRKLGRIHNATGRRGRISAAEASITVINTQALRLSPPDYLNDKEAAIFQEIVNSCDPRHFRKSELPLLCLYCTSVGLARYYSAHIGQEKQFFRQWESAAKLCAQLATKLRLAPQSRLKAEAVERHAVPDHAEPWEEEGA